MGTASQLALIHLLHELLFEVDQPAARSSSSYCQCLFLCKETDALYLTGLALVFCPELVSSSHPLEIATLFSTALIFGSSSGKSRRYFLLHREKLSQIDETVRLAAMILQSHRPSPTIEICRLYFVITLVFLTSELFRRR